MLPEGSRVNNSRSEPLAAGRGPRGPGRGVVLREEQRSQRLWWNGAVVAGGVGRLGQLSGWPNYLQRLAIFIALHI